MLEKIVKETFNRVYFADAVREAEKALYLGAKNESYESSDSDMEVPQGKSSDNEDEAEKAKSSTFERMKRMQEQLCGEQELLGQFPEHDMTTLTDSQGTRRASQRIMQFLGMTYFNNKHNYSVLDVLKHLANWDHDPSVSLSYNLSKAPFFLIINLLITLGRFSINMLKLITEFLPRALFAGLFPLAKEFFGLIPQCVGGLVDENKDGAEKILPLLGLVVMVVCSLVLGSVLLPLGLWYFIGCAVTSPADTVRSAYNTGDIIANRSFLGKVLGIFLATLSVLITTCAYAILFPLAIKLLLTQAPTILPAIANTISGIVGSFSASAGAATANFLMVTFPGFLAGWGLSISAWFAATSASVTGFLSTWLFTAPTIVGLTGLSAAVFSGTTMVAATVDKIGETTLADLYAFPGEFAASTSGAFGNGVAVAVTVGEGIIEGANWVGEQINEGLENIEQKVQRWQGEFFSEGKGGYFDSESNEGEVNVPLEVLDENQDNEGEYNSLNLNLNG